MPTHVATIVWTEFLNQGILMTSRQMARAFLTVFAATKTLHTIFSLILFAVAGLAEEPLDAANHLEAKLATLNPANPDLLADVELFHKGVVWALRYDTPLTPGDDALVRKALASGLGRAEALAAKKTDWTTKKGKVLRGFVSAVDGSTQPYGVIVPESYNSTRPIRLDVVLHGSSKPVGMSELRFGARFDEGDETVKPAPDVDFIELHPLGRVENCYRWAGKTDVFEAIEAVCRNYNIDRDRIVLRGM